MKKSSQIMGLAMCACLLLAGCGGRAGTGVMAHLAPAKVRKGGVTDWRQVATDADRIRLRGWRQAWIDAMALLPPARASALAMGDPALFDPDRALPGPTPPPGAYTCRVFKLGANGTAMRNVTMYPMTDCAVADEGGVSSLYKIAGAQRPAGLIFSDGPTRAVFLGTMVLGDETKPLAYGVDARRDMAGYIERIGPKRWRLVLPRPRFESVLDVVEIVPKH